MHLITHSSQCPIHPGHIDISSKARAFMGSIWENMETEISAYWLIKFAQRRDSWDPFEMAELEDLYHEVVSGSRFHFNKLAPDYIQEMPGTSSKLVFTTEFVAACYLVSPGH